MATPSVLPICRNGTAVITMPGIGRTPETPLIPARRHGKTRKKLPSRAFAPAPGQHPGRLPGTLPVAVPRLSAFAEIWHKDNRIQERGVFCFMMLSPGMEIPQGAPRPPRMFSHLYIILIKNPSKRACLALRFEKCVITSRNSCPLWRRIPGGRLWNQATVPHGPGPRKPTAPGPAEREESARASRSFRPCILTTS